MDNDSDESAETFGVDFDFGVSKLLAEAVDPEGKLFGPALVVWLLVFIVVAVMFFCGRVLGWW